MQIHYWIIHILVIVFLLGGLVFKATTIFEGNITKFGDRKILSKWKKFWHYIGRFFKNFFSKKFWHLILGLFLDVVFHFKLLRENPLKWFIHTLIFWGLFLLFILSILSGIAVVILPLFGYQTGMFWLADMLADADNRWTALLNDGLNLIITAGIILAFIKGFAQKRKIKMFESPDILLICFIALILISGWFTEAARYLAEETPYYIAKFGFIGYWLSIILKLIVPGAASRIWGAAHEWFWHIHVILVWLSFLYIPFSKLSHIIFSSIAGSVNSMEKRLQINKSLKGVR
ncbi:MAG: hypothetical protein PHU65_00805 [Actinomycetota bacterium]|nr:hypothetical protein [Actinomycetota bacterium]